MDTSHECLHIHTSTLCTKVNIIVTVTMVTWVIKVTHRPWKKKHKNVLEVLCSTCITQLVTLKTKPMYKSKYMYLNILYVSLYGLDEFKINDW